MGGVGVKIRADDLPDDGQLFLLFDQLYQA